jgi:hypothetical protein
MNEFLQTSDTSHATTRTTPASGTINGQSGAARPSALSAGVACARGGSLSISIGRRWDRRAIAAISHAVRLRTHVRISNPSKHATGVYGTAQLDSRKVGRHQRAIGSWIGSWNDLRPKCGGATTAQTNT